MCNRLDRIPACDRQTDGQTDGQTSCHGIVRGMHTRRAVKTDVKSVWKAVRQVTGARCKATEVIGISAESLNSHYASISTDPDFLHPIHKSTCAVKIQHFVLEWTVFRMLDQLRPTWTGLDLLPVWFLKLAAPVFCKPIAYGTSSTNIWMVWALAIEIVSVQL